VEATVSRTYVRSARSDAQYLRVTWHPETTTIVISHWDDRVCVASTPVALADAPVLINLLVAALADAAAGRTTDATTPPRRPTGLVARTWTRGRERLRRRRAPIVPLSRA
jgi:hypothetical protein